MRLLDLGIRAGDGSRDRRCDQERRRGPPRGRRSIRAGVATSTDVIVAQVALLETELARTRALANVRLAEARLERALGGSK